METSKSTFVDLEVSIGYNTSQCDYLVISSHTGCRYLIWYTPSRPLRSASTTSLVPNRNRTVRYGRRLLDTSAAALWNTMPEELRNAVNVVHFKRLLKRHFMRL